MKIVTVIEARRGLVEMPDKVMLPIMGEPMFVRVAERVAQTSLGGEIVVVTTNREEDLLIESVCREKNILCYRGDPRDLLDRLFQVATRMEADAIVRIAGDSPLIDPKVIDKVIDYYLLHKTKYDYVSNLHPPSYPTGNEVEVMSMRTLRMNWKSARRFYRSGQSANPNGHLYNFMRIGNITWERNLNLHFTHHWKVDCLENYRLVQSVYEYLYALTKNFTLDDILHFLDQQSENEESRFFIGGFSSCYEYLRNSIKKNIPGAPCADPV